MATLKLEDGTVYTTLLEIAQELAGLNVQFRHWAIPDNAGVRQLLAQEMLTDDEKTQVLAALDHYFERLKQTTGYQSRDLIVLHPQIPNLADMLAKFDRTHTHADAEVRYILDGEGVFGFVRPDGSQVELTVQAEEFITFPAGVEHWFYLTLSRRIKAVRYFTTTEGWVPEYTHRDIRFRAAIADQPNHAL